jgi:hypothetical protein
MSGFRFVALVALAWAMLPGCSGEAEPRQPAASQPTTAASATSLADPQPPAPEPEPSPLLPEAEDWSREEALARLADESAGLSAAVRLVRLAEVAPLCVPDPVPPRIARRLRLRELSDSLWALGLSTSDERRLAAPVLIDAAGEVTLPVDGVEEEVARLCCAKDPELFPHLLIVPGRVMMVGKDLQAALVADSPSGLVFDLRFDGEFPYVALLWRESRVPVDEGDQTTQPAQRAMARGDEPVEVARYEYDAYELAFMGPLSNKLPDPPGGLFELDLEASAALIPVGGVIPEPPVVEPPPFEPVEGEPTPY